MKDSIVNELITAMKDRLPPGQNLANFLTDTLCIGMRIEEELGDAAVYPGMQAFNVKR